MGPPPGECVSPYPAAQIEAGAGQRAVFAYGSDRGKDRYSRKGNAGPFCRELLDNSFQQALFQQRCRVCNVQPGNQPDDVQLTRVSCPRESDAYI